MSDMNISNSDLLGIITLMRTHIEIRNRSWMKRVYRDCFLGHDAVDFLVTQGFADNRKQAIDIGNNMIKNGLIIYISTVTNKRKLFQDSYLYYRFYDDNLLTSCLATTNAGNGTGTYLGKL